MTRYGQRETKRFVLAGRIKRLTVSASEEHMSGAEIVKS